MHILIVGGSRAERLDEALAQEDRLQFRPSAKVDVEAWSLPFVRIRPSCLPVAHPRLVAIHDIHASFPNRQDTGTRLILTQSSYTLQKWIDLLGTGDRIIATADREMLMRNAPEAFQERGAWRFFSIVSLEDRGQAVAARDARTACDVSTDNLLALAYGSDSAGDRHRLCRQAVSESRDSPIAALALASACRELQDPAGARDALDAAEALAPDWEAVHYEYGKFWLGCEEMTRARAAFERAADLMPTFSAAFSNLGATLGELDQPEAAVAAFARALISDPNSFTILNNIGVVNRELGRFHESEAALRRVTELEPGFIFGYYNLGHTRFLRGDFQGALSAYEEGQRRDPEKNRRQGCRLAMVRLATGDLAGATRDLWRFLDAAPPDEREDLLIEAYEIAAALINSQPALSACGAFVERLAAEIAGPTP